MKFSSDEEEAEARRFAEIAARAEARSEDKAKSENVISSSSSSSSSLSSSNISPLKESKGENEKSAKAATKFLSKTEREKAALVRLEERRNLDITKRTEERLAYERFISGKMEEEKRREARKQREEGERLRERRSIESNKKSDEADHELKAIREHYLGGTIARKKVLYVFTLFHTHIEKFNSVDFNIKCAHLISPTMCYSSPFISQQITRASEKFARIFQFNWEEDDDTSKNDKNPLYNQRQHINPLFGRGYIAGVDLRYVYMSSRVFR